LVPSEQLGKIHLPSELQNLLARQPLSFGGKDPQTAKVIGISQQLPFWGKRAIKEEIAQYDGITLNYTKKSVYQCMDQVTYTQAMKTNIAIHEEHNRVNPSVAKGLEEMRKARGEK